VFDPKAALEIVDDLAAPGLLVLGADWSLLDASLTDRVAERMLVDAEARHVAFAQVPAGLAACALARPAIAEIANNLSAGAMASIGGLLAYTPHMPRPDPIARDICVRVEPSLRDLGRRLIVDSDDRRFAFDVALREVAKGNEVTPLLMELASASPQRPTHLRAVLSMDADHDLADRVQAFASGAGDAAVTLDCEACGFTEFAADLARNLHKLGAACVHVRTPLAWGDEEIERLLQSEVDIISVDVVDPSFPPSLEAFPESTDRGMCTPWIVPRLHRNESMLPIMLEQYDQAIMTHGCALVQPDPNASDDRLAALPLPGAALRRLNREDRQTEAKSVGSSVSLA